jgi:hypothetical protein
MNKNKKKIAIGLILFIILIVILYYIKIKILDKSTTSTSTSTSITTSTSSKKDNKVDEDDEFDTSIQGRHRDFSGPIPIYGMIAPDGAFRSAPAEYKSPQPYLTGAAHTAVSFIVDPFIIHGIIHSIVHTKVVQKMGTFIKESTKTGLKATLKLVFGTRNYTSLLKVGLIAGKKAAEVFGRILATRIGTMATSAAMAGPAAPVIFAAEFAFAMISMGLDIADVGGYGQMKSNNILVDYKNAYDDAFIKQLKNEEGLFKLQDWQIPVVVGPDFDTFFESLSEKEQEGFLGEAFRDLFFSQDPLVQPLINKIIEDINDPEIRLTLEDLEQKEYLIYEYINILDMETMAKCKEKIEDVYCIQNNGKIFQRPDKRVCSYKDKKSCDGSYTWPRRQEEDEELPEDLYCEYKEDLADNEGACILASSLLRSQCELAELDYNTSTGLCTVNERYCKEKGADWKDNDCYISPGQDVLEMIFGKTITRGVKQFFDLGQYETCVYPEYEWHDVTGLTSWVKYFCIKNGCDEGDEECDGFCYPKCREGYENSLCLWCTPKKMGLPIVRSATKCPERFELNTLGLCVETDCGKGEWMSSPGLCQMNDCPEGSTHSTPGFCWKNCYPDLEGLTPGMCKRKCGEDYANVAGVCWAKIYFKDKYERQWGKGWCHPHGCCSGPEYCPNDDKHWESACFCGEHYCKEGWSDKWGKGGLHNYCYKDCPPGWLDDGISCRIYKPIEELSYVENYPKESFETIRPVKRVPATCTDDEMNYPGDLLCYAKCEEGWEQSSVGYCTLKGLKPYFRGFGYATNTMRPKNRIIDYSTKDDIWN